MMGNVGKCVRFALVSSICLLGWSSTATAQGITSTPPRIEPPAASYAPVKKDDAPKRRKVASASNYSDQDDGSSSSGETTSAPPTDAHPISSTSHGLPTPKIDIHGGAWLFWWLPFGVSTDPIAKARGVKDVPDEKEFFRLHLAHINFDGSIGDFGLFFNGNIRDTKMRDFYVGTAWLEEGYAYYKNPKAFIKVGKSYNRFSLFWENSFYGNVQFYDGIKLDPDYGVSLEGAVGKETGPRLGYYGQYFIVDGRTNGSYVGRDTISIPGARRRHMAVLRLEPSYYWSKESNVTLGLSGEYFQADLPKPVGPQNVFRFGGDFWLNVGPFSIWGDYFKQLGQSVMEYPIPPSTDPLTGVVTPGRASANNDYFLVGAEARIKKVVLRYNFSAVRYMDVGISEFFHVPGIGYNMNDYLQFLVEFAYWNQRSSDGRDTLLDRTLATTIHGYF